MMIQPLIMNNLILRDRALSFFWPLPYELRRKIFSTIFPDTYRTLQAMRHMEIQGGYSLKPYIESRCIFIHIPKCAGISICRSLFGNLAGGHLSAPVYQLLFPREEYDDYFKFTVVRNPWDRVVSAYFYLKNGGINAEDRRWAKRHLLRYPDFETFVKRWINRRNVRTWIHFRPQFKYACTPKSRPALDFIAYFENIDKDFEIICDRLGRDASLIHFNKTRGKRKDYREYYTPETRRIVSEAYPEDIEYFGYDFDNAGLPRLLANRPAPRPSPACLQNAS